MPASRPRLRGIAAATLLAFMTFVQAQAAQPADLFDFWVGDWDASWTNADGSTGRGRNRLVKILDDSVIEENFEETPDGRTPPLKGRSLSVLHQASGVWHQAWADNQGGWFSFSGRAEGDTRLFVTDVVEKDGKRKVQRMVFHDIRPDAFTWDWEGSDDGGQTWKRLWRIDYRRQRP